MRIPHVSPKNLTGFLDKLLGLGKEFAGEILDKRSLVQAGEAQQDKGSEKLKALRAELEADAHDAKAKVAESRQLAAQSAK